MIEHHGRRDEIASVLAILDAGSSTVVSGELGAGKSALARSVTMRLRDDGVLVTTLRANSATRNIAFGVLAGFIDPTARTDPAVQIAAATERLRHDAAGRRHVVVIDDAQFLDPSTIAVLADLSTPTDNSTAVPLLATARSTDPALDELQDLWHSVDARRIVLGPLDAGAMQQLVIDQLDAAHEGTHDLDTDRDAVVSAIVGRADGNPLFARELTRAHLDGDPEGLSSQLVELVEQRLCSIDEADRAQLAMISVGQPLDIAAVDIDAVRRLERMGFVTTRALDDRLVALPVHPIYGEVVMHGMSALQRATTAHRLVGALGDQPVRRRGDALRIVTWFLDAGDVPPTDLASAAALEAIGWLDSELAERLALSAVTRERSAATLYVLGEVHRVAGRASVAAECWSEAFELADGDDDIRRIALALGQLNELFLGRPETSHEILQAAYDRIQDPSLRIGIASDLALEQRHRSRAERAVEIDVLLSDPQCGDESAWTALSDILWAKSSSLDVDGIDGYIDQAMSIEQRLPADRDAEIDLIRAISINVPMIRGRLDEAIDVAAAWRVDAAERGIAAGLGDFSAALIELLRGDADAAERCIRRAIASMGAYDAFNALPMVLAAGSVVAAAGGDVDLAVSRLTHAEERSAGVAPWFELWSSRAQGWIAAASGDQGEACRHALVAVKHARESGDDGWGAFALQDAVGWGWENGDDVHVPSATHRSDCALFESIFDHAVGAFDHDAGRLAHCARRFEEFGAPWLAGTAWANRAAVDTDPIEACRDATRALVLAPEHVLRAGTNELALTARQREVVRRAADGASSKAIGVELFLSARTVDNHLREAYRRLGVGGRAELLDVVGAP